MGTTLELVNELKEYVKKTFDGAGYDFYPNRPYALVRVIPKQAGKELRVLHGPNAGKMVTLETPSKQNKPNWEGQVLRTYKPWMKSILHDCEHCGDKVVKEVLQESPYKPGDHILFPHFTVIPVPELCLYNYWKNGDYVLVEEQAILGIVEYTETPDDEKLKVYLRPFITERFALERAVRGLMENATVIFGREAKTTSGK